MFFTEKQMRPRPSHLDICTCDFATLVEQIGQHVLVLRVIASFFALVFLLKNDFPEDELFIK